MPVNGPHVSAFLPHNTPIRPTNRHDCLPSFNHSGDVRTQRSRSEPIISSWVINALVLERCLAEPLDDARAGHGQSGLLDSIHLHLMKPVVAKVEPVTEDAFLFQIQVVQT